MQVMIEKSFWRTSRAWQGLNFSIVIELIATQKTNIKKAYLVANIHDATFAISQIKPSPLMPSSAFSDLYRKYLPNGILIGTWNSDHCSILQIKHNEENFYLYFEKSPLHILHFIAQNKSLVRLSLKGNYTKAMSFEVPHIHEWTALSIDVENSTPASSKSPKSQIDQDIVKRLKRRARTLQKSLKKHSLKVPNNDEINLWIHKINLYSESLQNIPYGRASVELLDPTTGQKIFIELDPTLSPGANLDAFHKTLKRLKKSQEIGGIYLKKLLEEVTDLNDFIQQITSKEILEIDIQKILHRFHIPFERQKNSQSDFPLESTPYREFVGKSGSKFLVGKSAEDNDRLCKGAKGNDYWFHTASAQGSHVILPAKYIKNRKIDPLQLKEGAILALHFSKKRADQAGEVHFTTRNLIKKTKGLAPGLWIIIRGETTYIRYDVSELRAILDNTSQT
jgi:hypothetical protein